MIIVLIAIIALALLVFAAYCLGVTIIVMRSGKTLSTEDK